LLNATAIVDKSVAKLSNASEFRKVGKNLRRSRQIEFLEDYPLMLILIQGLLVLVGIGELVCLILVLIKMFQAGEQTMGIICIVLLLCCGIGGLVVFIYGWINATKWDIKNIMLIWTGLFIAAIVLYGIAFASGAVLIPQAGGIRP